ncbi:hypothetical protein PV768_01595 [Pseudarthrobacter sp. CC4]|uniref:hypothetical protein n=1 Tax=Pseudarthrobacter sp. CC4 TaxID=3029190 RepID=UPI003B8E95EF
MKIIFANSLQRISETSSHLKAAHTLANNGQYERSISERTLISEACFLNLFITLEEFLEASFAHYLVGKMSTARWRPSRFAKPTSLEHAQRMLIGSQRFVDWSTPDTVLKFADLYFLGGEPFRTPLAGAKSHLQGMKTVRNSTAHLSSTTRAALDGLYSRWTGTPSSGITAYEMLMARGVQSQNTFYGTSEQVVQAIIASVANRSS